MDKTMRKEIEEFSESARKSLDSAAATSSPGLALEHLDDAQNAIDRMRTALTVRFVGYLVGEKVKAALREVDARQATAHWP